MVTQSVIDWACGFVSWLATLFPAWDIPPSLAAPGTLVGQIMTSFIGLGAWVDWVVLAAVAVAVIGTWSVLFTIKLLLKLAAHIPAVGGSG